MNTKPISLNAVLLHIESVHGQPGVESIVEYLRSKKLKIGLFSDHSKKSMRDAEVRLKLLGISDLDVILSGDELRERDAESNAVVLAAEALRVDPLVLLVVAIVRRTAGAIGGAGPGAPNDVSRYALAV